MAAVTMVVNNIYQSDRAVLLVPTLQESRPQLHGGIGASPAQLALKRELVSVSVHEQESMAKHDND